MVKTYRYNGYVYSTLESGLRFIRFKPDNYNQESIVAIRKEVDSKPQTNKETAVASSKLTKISDNSSNKPNILFGQLEGFMDPMSIDKVMYSKDPIPNFRKLQKNGISGKMKTPSIGGGTARTEFEVMTGLDLEFLTDGEVPHYTILGHETLNSVASTLKKQGIRHMQSTIIKVISTIEIRRTVRLDMIHIHLLTIWTMLRELKLIGQKIQCSQNI